MKSALLRAGGVLETLLGFFYPNACQLCGAARATAAEGFVCTRCAQKVRFVVEPFCERCGLPFEGDITTKFECSNCREMELHFTRARAAVVANDFLLDVLHRYKYSRAVWFEPFLAGLLARQAAPALRGGAWDLLVPVPLHSVKEREREFNQAERLATRLGQAVNLPVDAHLLRRARPTQTQTRLSRADRATNVARAFAPRDGVTLRGERIVLVDDVLTTGATTSACAQALRAAGAGDVCVWTLARGILGTRL